VAPSATTNAALDETMAEKTPIPGAPTNMRAIFGMLSAKAFVPTRGSYSDITVRAYQ
jgi:hypothetical protein